MFTKYTILTAILFLALGLAEQNCQLRTIRLPFGNCSFSAASGSYVYSTGILLGVGPTDSVCGMPSTVLNSTLIQSSDVCADKWLSLKSGSTPVNMTIEQCRSRRGGYVDRDDLTAASSNDLSYLSKLNPGWVSITNDTDTPFRYAVEADLRMQDQSVTMLEGLISEGQQHAMSHIGLAEASTLLQSLKDADLIGAKSWGLDAGSQSFNAPRNGSLVLGGYDASSFEGGWFSYDIPKSNLIGRNTSRSESPITPGNPLTACIEPYDNQFRFPDSILGATHRLLGKDDAVDSSKHPDLYNLESGLLYESSANISFSITITIEDGLKIEIPSHELVRPLRGLDKDGVPAVNSSFTEVQVFAEEGPLAGPVLGKVFLSQVYLFVNQENSTFSLARQKSGQTFLDVKSSGKCPSASILTKTDKGLIAVGVVLGVLIIVIVCYVANRCWMAPLTSSHTAPDPEAEQIQRPNDLDFPEIPTPPRAYDEER